MRTPNVSLRTRAMLYLVIAAFLLAIPFYAIAEPNTPVIVELFTSEGCSSCPPADAFLRTLDATQPVAGVHLIVLGEHVDYWDGLGWKDTFSSHAFTVRQTVYADRLHVASPYTPQMVVDGTFDVLGSDRKRAEVVFERARPVSKIALTISSVKVDHGKVTAHIQTGTLSSGVDVFLALTLEHAQSQVLGGENGGHRLEHVAVVLNLSKVGQTIQGQLFSKDVTLDVIRPNQDYRLVAFLQESNQGKILGAAVERVQK